MNDGQLKSLAELHLVLLLLSLLMVDFWKPPLRHARIVVVCTAVVLFVTFMGLVIARFVTVAG
jgi:hypothetical protein